MTFWKRNEPLQIGSQFYTLDPATGRIDRDQRPFRLSSVFERNAFLRELPVELRSNFQEMAQFSSREHRRGVELRGPTAGAFVHIVLRGCVVERTQVDSSATTVRILGAGAVLGCMEVFDEELPTPKAECLNDTWTMSVPMDRIRALAESHPRLLKAIGISTTDRIQATERIYHRGSAGAEQRLAGLLAHLVMHCAVPSTTYDYKVEGPSQSHLAEALSLSTGSIESALQSLRLKKIVITGYRSYEFPSLRRLLEASGLSFPPESLAGALSSF
ncbi:Crp/Fnr family transcriptional regulator [Streptomyces californicus]|uniref:Crp/Fnr family transcriptional regulator n=1 Tax=Streptomyces californicus TaxID=67351 RepID=UPI00378EED41